MLWFGEINKLKKKYLHKTCRNLNCTAKLQFGSMQALLMQSRCLTNFKANPSINRLFLGTGKKNLTGRVYVNGLQMTI